MNLVICMAGYNTRFHDVGFDIPKYLLPWNGKTIIYDILKNIGWVNQLILVANKRDIYFKDQLVEAIKPLGWNESNILYIGDTIRNDGDLWSLKDARSFQHFADVRGRCIKHNFFSRKL